MQLTCVVDRKHAVCASKLSEMLPTHSDTHPSHTNTRFLHCFRGRPPSDHDDRDAGPRQFNSNGGGPRTRRDDIPLEVCVVECLMSYVIDIPE